MIEIKNPQRDGIHTGLGTKEFTEKVVQAEEGCGIEVQYDKNGMEVTASGTVRVIEDKRDPYDSFDIRFEDNTGENYLHVNDVTGDYYFQDSGREKTGRELLNLRIYK